ncbi:UDP-3-O-acyl-N-acetylglucosamine deacetylase [Roseitranquillus sediminis]|uniref:UDP-3-O-acyl-N-acetylglucosamine deacetylase n=1 Tax=Roseitranquillus sediminis TaxID=2809051 RepID=UPI001D0C07E4|nr:UDP-3-O-acyl-N-acetylglucosamine deacetylase [Roseitranquillus sediminis]MBM9594611.1 UDP-3-O-acyl-N-acetylglucosamine deacetylase [Roseitranquillus sediminis]
MQTTLKTAVTFTGVGLHTGQQVRMTLRPAMAEAGVWFNRIDVRDNPWICARWNAVTPSQLCTLVVNEAGVSVSTIEHVMAAIAGCGLNNVIVEIDGPEVPIMDGSAADFVAGILSARLVRQNAPVRALRVMQPVEVRRGDAVARLEPAEGFGMEFHIDFPDAAIGRQAMSLDLANGAFVRELCDSRTFCRNSDVSAMRAQGLILGGSVENAVVVDGAEVLTPGGLRHADEAVRHKMLDALGDLALAGAPIIGRYVGHRAGHAMTNLLLREVFARPDAVRLVACGGHLSARLPGAGVTRSDLSALAA